MEASSDPLTLGIARGLIHAAHPDESPLVVDPFAGGGSIPLEALRLGCETFASDLNPVACLILKVMLEDIPRHGPALAEELRRVGAEIKAAAERELAEFYPPDPDGARPIAYLWARTVQCESPNCGAEIPLMRSLWLAKKANRRRALRARVERPAGQPPRVAFEVYEPQSEAEVPTGTVSRARATCLCCGTVLPPERVRAQLAAQRGGADATFDDGGRRIGGARLLAVVTLRTGEQGRHYRTPTEQDYQAIWKSARELESAASERGTSGLSHIPDEPLPVIGTLGFRVQRYGMLQWGDLFTARQKLALITLVCGVQSISGASPELKAGLALALSRCTDRNSSLTRWDVSSDNIGSTFARQALPFVWDFAEAVPLGGASGDWQGMIGWIVDVADGFSSISSDTGQIQLLDAVASPLPDASTMAWFTDPPYYDAVPYADRKRSREYLRRVSNLSNIAVC